MLMKISEKMLIDDREKYKIFKHSYKNFILQFTIYDTKFL